MGLSSNIISQFIKVTKNEKPKTTEATVYGTVRIVNGETRVQLDGSTVADTPVTTTVRVIDGDRVLVKVKDHSAVITGNLTTQAIRTDEFDVSLESVATYEYVRAIEVLVEDSIEAANGRFDDLVTEDATIRDLLTATNADISSLKAKDVTISETLTAHAAIINSLTSGSIDTEFLAAHYATIEALNATKADVYNLSVTYGDFVDLTTDRFTAYDADIADLQTNKLSAVDAELRYANIDFANIGEAAIESFYSKTGLIDNLVVSAGSVTGTLVGVTIKGDLIEGGTVVADKLVVKGEDGLYYKLNTDGVTTEAEQTDYNSLNGSVILAKSITATKISVDDLVAFDATIGGFKIGNDSLYSGVKESIDNSTSGIFLGSDGQVAFGNDDNYLKFYAVYAYYNVTHDEATGIYTKSDTEIDMIVGTIVEDALTSDGHRVYLSEDGNTYFCRVATDYRLAISADSIMFGTGSKYSMEDVKQLTDHVKIGSYVDAETGEALPCVELSEMDSSFRMRLTNKSATFADGINDSTVIDSDGIETENLRVKNDIRHYDYVWRRRANGNLGLMWMEVTE